MPTPALHPHPFFRINGYNVTSLPFAPTAINDSGVIVGRMYSSSTDSSAEVAVAYFGSTLTVLPPPAGLTGSYSALDISSSGHVLGTGGGSMLIWPGRASAPLVVGHSDTSPDSR